MSTTIGRTILVFALAMLVPGLAQAQWGSIKGQFVFDGAKPEPADVKVDKDVATCGKCMLKQESLVVGDNGGLANVVIYLNPSRAQAKKLKVHPEYDSDAENVIELANSCCRFDPHIVTLRTTQTLRITNPDPVGHNSNVTTLKNPAINPSIPAGGQIEAKFTKEENLPCKVSCNIHPWMGGYVVIKDHPYVAVTDKDGNFEIKDLPVGEWTFRAWHESAGYVAKVKIGGSETSRRGEFDVTIKDGDTIDLGQIKTSDKIFK